MFRCVSLPRLRLSLTLRLRLPLTLRHTPRVSAIVEAGVSIGSNCSIGSRCTVYAKSVSSGTTSRSPRQSFSFFRRAHQLIAAFSNPAKELADHSVVYGGSSTLRIEPGHSKVCPCLRATRPISKCCRRSDMLSTLCCCLSTFFFHFATSQPAAYVEQLDHLTASLHKFHTLQKGD